MAIAITQAEREKYLSAEPGVCPICGAHLQGHGWRNRYVVGLNGCFMILVHRKLCPNCKMTFTLHLQAKTFKCEPDALAAATELGKEWPLLKAMEPKVSTKTVNKAGEGVEIFSVSLAFEKDPQAFEDIS